MEVKQRRGTSHAGRAQRCYPMQMCFRVLLLPLLAAGLIGQDRPSSCASCPAWNVPQQPIQNLRQ